MRRHTWSRSELGAFVYEVWKIRLLPWQLDDLFAFVTGGIYAYSIPTYHGKSMLVEMAHVARLCCDGNRRQLAVKSNDTTAAEMSVEVCRRLVVAATEIRSGGAPTFPWVMPKCKWSGRSPGEPVDMRRHTPYGIKDGFDVEGIDHLIRHRSTRSFRAYGIGDKDLQGKGGDTSVDDVETLEHADSEAERRVLARRLDGIIRTIGDDIAEIMWVLVGTPMYSESVYNQITERLEGLTVPWARILRPYQNQDGSHLMPSQVEKVTIQRAMMSKRAAAAAFDLVPPRQRRLNKDEIRDAIRDTTMPWIENERQFGQWFLDWAMRNSPPYMAPTTWRKYVEEKIGSELQMYVCWDPATENDWAIVLLAMWGDYGWILRCVVDDTDVWDQMMTVKDIWLHFPSARLLLETNGQQKVFLDVAREDDVLKHVPFARHTSQGKEHPRAGLPGMMEFLREGYIRTPWADEGRADLEFGPLEREIERHSSTAHPHALMATWFGWRYHRRHRLGNSIRTRIAAEEVKRQTQPVRIETPRTTIIQPRSGSRGPTRSDAQRAQAQRAWRRRH
jgi:hypothetical protein